MLNNLYFGFVHFVPLSANSPKLFGFSEFLAGLALMVLAWTIADVRYRFRVRTTPLPMQGITFIVVGAVGILTLLTDLWRAEQWLVPKGNLITPSEWQAILGGLYLLTFLAWVWYAFISPPVYGKRNAKRYARTLYQSILKGSPSELAIIADEFTSSVKSLVKYATNGRESQEHRRNKSEKEKPPEVTAYANDLLFLIADKRFCQAIVDSSPGTALAIFREIEETKKYDINIKTFAKNIVNIALTNKNSFLFHEASGYQSGLIGHHKPLSQAMFANYNMVEAIGTLLDLDVWDKEKWDADQWKAYSRVVLITLQDYVNNGDWRHSYVLNCAMDYIERSVTDLYKINDSSTIALDNDILARLRVATEFITSAVDILEKKGVPKRLVLRKRKDNYDNTLYDRLSNMIFEVIFAASAVHKPVDRCWWIQYNNVWHKFFNFHSLNGNAGNILKFRVRRLIYNEVSEMQRFPNFKGARILGFCLNVMGLTLKKETYYQDSKALQKAILSWTKKNYAWLHSYNAKIAEACLVDGMSYDTTQMRLVKTFPAEGLRRKPEFIYFTVDTPQPDTEATIEEVNE